MRSVFSALKYFPGNQGFDELTIVNDRGDRDAIESALAHIGLHAEILDLTGPPGHRGQARAWNAGYATLTTSHVVCISSDCILLPGSISNLLWFARRFPEKIIFGRAEHAGRGLTIRYQEAGTELSVTTKTIAGARRGMPEGYVWMLPVSAIRETGGWNDAMTDGVCYDHTDFFYRLVKSGRELVVVDDVCAVHIEHPKPHIEDSEGMARNQAIFEAAHGVHTVSGWQQLLMDTYDMTYYQHPPMMFCFTKGPDPIPQIESTFDILAKEYLPALPAMSEIEA
jgi:hypothetical protein